MAIATRRCGDDTLTFVITGDGELNEGIVWEAAMNITKYKLHNLIAIVEYNGALLDKILIANTGITPVGYGGTAEDCSIVGIDQGRGEEGLQIYPNPSTGNLRVESGQGFSCLEILSLDGKILLSRIYGRYTRSDEVNLQLDAGLYLLRVSNKEYQRFSRLLIQ